MTRSPALLLGAMLLVAASPLGCKKDGAGQSGAKAATSALAVLPKGTTILFGVDANKASKASFLKPLMDKMTSEMSGKAKDAKEKCGLDVTSGLVQNVVVALVDPQNEKTGFVAVSMSLPRAKANECATKLNIKVEEKGKLTTYTDEHKKFTGMWADDNMVVVSTDEEATEATFAPVLTNPGVDKGGPLGPYLGKAKTGAILWAAGVLPPAMGAMAQGAKGFYASLDGDKDIDINAAIAFEKEDQAKNMKTMAEGQLGQLGMFLGDVAKKIKVGQSGSELTVGVQLSQADVEDLKKKFGGMFGLAPSPGGADPHMAPPPGGAPPPPADAPPPAPAPAP